MYHCYDVLTLGQWVIINAQPIEAATNPMTNDKLTPREVKRIMAKYKKAKEQELLDVQKIIEYLGK